MRRLAAPLLLALSACWVPVEKGRQMDERLVRLEADQASMARQIEEQRAVIRERITRVDQKLDELNVAANRTGAGVVAGQDRLQEDVTRLRGQMEEDLHRLQQMEQQLGQLRGDTDARFAALKGAGALDEFEARRKAESLSRPADKAAFFALAQKQEQAGEKGVARQLYEEYAKKWPTDPRAADAWFRLGEISYGEKRYREAVLAYGKVAQDFPRSDKAPDALYRTGEAMIALDLKTDARAILEDVVARYPKTSAARKASSRLAEIKKQAPKKAAPKK
jgi:tol-pal system protein YbgF